MVRSNPFLIMQQYTIAYCCFLHVFRQWLPRLKLDFLGTDDTVDQTKLQEGKKTSWKRSVQEAFKRAVAHQKKVDGQLPVTSDSESTESSDGE